MFDTVDTKKGLYFMGFKKKNPKTKGYKNNDFSQDFEFLVDIVGKCIPSKDSAHDFVNELQL